MPICFQAYIHKKQFCIVLNRFKNLEANHILICLYLSICLYFKFAYSSTMLKLHTNIQNTLHNQAASKFRKAF